MLTPSELYDQDFYTWTQHNLILLQTGRLQELDVEHLIEELNEMGNSQRHELENHLVILLAHLLKWQFQYAKLNIQWQEFTGQSWRSTIIEQRNRIRKRLQRSPGLKAKLESIIQEAYQDARELAAEESGLPLTKFPSICPYTWNQIIAKEFYPQSVD